MADELKIVHLKQQQKKVEIYLNGEILEDWDSFLEKIDISNWFLPSQGKRQHWKGFVEELEELKGKKDYQFFFEGSTSDRKIVAEALAKHGYTLQDDENIQEATAKKDFSQQSAGNRQKNTGEQDYQSALSYGSKNSEKRLKFLQKAGEKGHIQAQFDLGVWYAGKDPYRQETEHVVELMACPPDEKTALERMDTSIFWYKKAANNGHLPSQYNLSDTYIDWWDLGRFPDDAEEREKKSTFWLKKAAEQDFVPAQFEVAERFIYGVHIKKDEKQGLAFMVLAGEQGHNKAISFLIRFYSDKRKSTYDLKKYQHWCEKGVEKNIPVALRRSTTFLGKGRDNEILAFQRYQSAAEQGDMLSQYQLGLFYFFEKGTPEDIDEETRLKKAVYWYEKAAEQGHSSAQRRLGKKYYYGQGVEEDAVIAATWFEKAAEQGDEEATFLLANCYRLGAGVWGDCAKAYEYYKILAEKDDAPSQFLCGEYLMFQFHMTNSSGKPYKLEDTDADTLKMMLGKPTAKEEMGEMLGDFKGEGIAGLAVLAALGPLGYGVAKMADGVDRLNRKIGEAKHCIDAHKALAWYQKAATQDYAPAVQRVNELSW